ncbi:hypothetical protein GGI42DRAFT_358921 [Trichoderma sp. SZMC 28013]
MPSPSFNRAKLGVAATAAAAQTASRGLIASIFSGAKEATDPNKEGQSFTKNKMLSQINEINAQQRAKQDVGSFVTINEEFPVTHKSATRVTKGRSQRFATTSSTARLAAITAAAFKTDPETNPEVEAEKIIKVIAVIPATQPGIDELDELAGP